MELRDWLLTIIAYTLVVHTLASGGEEISIAVIPIYLTLIALPIFALLQFAEEVREYGRGSSRRQKSTVEKTDGSE